MWLVRTLKKRWKKQACQKTVWEGRWGTLRRNLVLLEELYLSLWVRKLEQMTFGGPFQPTQSCGSTAPKPYSKPSPEHGQIRVFIMMKSSRALVQNNKSLLRGYSTLGPGLQKDFPKFSNKVQSKCWNQACCAFWRVYCKAPIHLQEVPYLLWESNVCSEMGQKADQEHALLFLVANSLCKSFREASCLITSRTPLLVNTEALYNAHRKQVIDPWVEKPSFQLHKWPGILDKTRQHSPIICPIHSQ